MVVVIVVCQCSKLLDLFAPPLRHTDTHTHTPLCFVDSLVQMRCRGVEVMVAVEMERQTAMLLLLLLLAAQTEAVPSG